MKARELIAVGPVNGWAEYIPMTAKGSKLTIGWMLRLEIDDHAIEGWGNTQDEARFMLEETARQWLKNTNLRPVIA